MEFIKITEDNLEQEHICCAITSNKDCQVAAKKTWIKQQLKDGLVFLKANVRGKCFIEYMPVASTTYALFCDGKFVTNEILSEKKFLKMCGVEQ